MAGIEGPRSEICESPDDFSSTQWQLSLLRFQIQEKISDKNIAILSTMFPQELVECLEEVDYTQKLLDDLVARMQNSGIGILSESQRNAIQSVMD